jgi:hypothetical protein
MKIDIPVLMQVRLVTEKRAVTILPVQGRYENLCQFCVVKKLDICNQLACKVHERKDRRNVYFKKVFLWEKI